MIGSTGSGSASPQTSSAFSFESSQLKKNLQIMEEDFNTLAIQVASSMNKMSSNNAELSKLLKQSVSEYCDEVLKSKNLMQSIISDCENIQDQFIHVEILQKKIVVEEIARNKERELLETELTKKD